MMEKNLIARPAIKIALAIASRTVAGRTASMRKPDRVVAVFSSFMACDPV
jgi:hypothetical protein